MRSGKHAAEAHPGTVFLGVVALFVVLGLVGMVAWRMCGQAALDWRDGPVTREGVTCTAMNPEAHDDGPFAHIELTEEGGRVRAYDLREYELERHAEKGTPLYTTIVEACQAPGTQIGTSIGSVRPKCVLSTKSKSDGHIIFERCAHPTCLPIYRDNDLLKHNEFIYESTAP